MISFQNQSISFKLRHKTKLKLWITQVIKKEKCKPGNISYVFCNDEELLKINIEHLNHNTYTDIITFDYREKNRIDTDIFISIDRVIDNAKKYKVDFENELHRVMIHGILHNCGYKDKKKVDIKMMRYKESQSLELLSQMI